jgi:hypothetical protein
MIETQNNIVSDNLLNKIKGLLRLSNSSNEHEAQLAMSRAMALCTKHNLNLAQIEAFDTKKKNEPIVQDKINVGGRKSICQSWVTYILQDYFNVKILYGGSRGWGGKHIIFIGRNRDIEIASYLNQYLNAEFLRLWNKYYKENEFRGVTLNDRGGYIHGLSIGLREKLEASQKKTESDSFEEIATSKPTELSKIKECYALAVINHEEELKKKTEEFYPHLAKAYGGRTIKNYNAVNDGKAAGKNISLNRPLSNGGGKSSLTY